MQNYLLSVTHVLQQPDSHDLIGEMRAYTWDFMKYTDDFTRIDRTHTTHAATILPTTSTTSTTAANIFSHFGISPPIILYVIGRPSRPYCLCMNIA